MYGDKILKHFQDHFIVLMEEKQVIHLKLKHLNPPSILLSVKGFNELDKCNFEDAVKQFDLVVGVRELPEV